VNMVRARHSGWRHVATFPCGLRHNVWPFIRGRLARVYAYPRATLPITLHWRCCPQAVESIALLDLLCCFTAYVLTTPAGQALGEEAEERWDVEEVAEPCAQTLLVAANGLKPFPCSLPAIRSAPGVHGAWRDAHPPGPPPHP
jgi:hypothetical protein